MRVLLICFLSMSLLACCAEAPKKYNSAPKTQSKESNSNVLKDVGGHIFKKVGPPDYDVHYFLIQLDQGGTIEWETSLIKYSQKEVGDRVHFEYIRRDRINN